MRSIAGPRRSAGRSIRTSARESRSARGVRARARGHGCACGLPPAAPAAPAVVAGRRPGRAGSLRPRPGPGLVYPGPGPGTGYRYRGDQAGGINRVGSTRYPIPGDTPGTRPGMGPGSARSLARLVEVRCGDSIESSERSFAMESTQRGGARPSGEEIISLELSTLATKDTAPSATTRRREKNSWVS
jgi:hypothetical protein